MLFFDSINTWNNFFVSAVLSNTSSDQTLSENLTCLLTQPGTNYVRTEFCICDCGGIGQIQDKGNFEPVIKTCKTKDKTVS